MQAVAPYTRHLLDCFGPHRLLWGSDWPVLELAGTYPAWHAAARAQVPAAQQAQVFADTALRSLMGSAIRQTGDSFFQRNWYDGGNNPKVTP